MYMYIVEMQDDCEWWVESNYSDRSHHDVL